MVRISVLNDCLRSIFNAEKRGSPSAILWACPRCAVRVAQNQPYSSYAPIMAMSTRAHAGLSRP